MFVFEMSCSLIKKKNSVTETKKNGCYIVYITGSSLNNVYSIIG